MNKQIIQNGLLAAILALSSSAVTAEPVLTALLSLLVLEKVTPEAKKSNQAERMSWQDQLSDAEYTVLDVMKSHPAIDSCVKAANERSPIAEYHLIKIARFSAQIRQGLVEDGELPDIESMQYKWPAKAFRWCAAQAGITSVSSEPRDLDRYAYDIARIVHSRQANDTSLATNYYLGNTL